MRQMTRQSATAREQQAAALHMRHTRHHTWVAVHAAASEQWLQGNILQRL